MTRPDPDIAATGAACKACKAFWWASDAEPARIGPMRFTAGLVRAAIAVGVVALAARVTPDPIDIVPRVLRDA